MRGAAQSCSSAAAVALLAGCAAAYAFAQAGHLTTGDVLLHYWPSQQRLARALLPAPAALSFAGLPANTLRAGTPLNVYLAPDPARWDSLTAGRAPEWGAGIALPQEDVIVIPGYVSERADTHELPQILRHELAHIALHRFIRNTHIPRWFDEGYAMWSAGQFDVDAGWKLRLGFITRRAPPLDSLSLDWPLIATDARLAYLLSATAVRYLYSLASPATFERFLHTMRDRASFEDALRQVYVLSTPQFERQWRQHVRREYGWLQLIAQTTFLWLVATLALLVLFVIQRRRDRRKLAALRATEPPDEPAYWMDAQETGAERNDEPQGPEPENGHRL